MPDISIFLKDIKRKHRLCNSLLLFSFEPWVKCFPELLWKGPHSLCKTPFSSRSTVWPWGHSQTPPGNSPTSILLKGSLIYLRFHCLLEVTLLGREGVEIPIQSSLDCQAYAAWSKQAIISSLNYLIKKSSSQRSSQIFKGGALLKQTPCLHCQEAH